MKKIVLISVSLLLASASWAQDKAAGKAAPAAKAAAPAAAASAAPPAAPTMTPEGKRWVEAFLGKWKAKDVEFTMGGQKMTGTMTLSCEKASGGWGALCKGKTMFKGMPPQDSSYLMGFDVVEGTAHMFEVANTSEVHDHKGKWTDDKTITMAYTGKNPAGQMETDSLTFTLTNPKSVAVKGTGMAGKTETWSFSCTANK